MKIDYKKPDPVRNLKSENNEILSKKRIHQSISRFHTSCIQPKITINHIIVNKYLTYFRL